MILREQLVSGNAAAQAALAAHEAGLSVVPPTEDGLKHPRGRWKEYQERRPALEELTEWYEEGLTGVGIVCGKVSGDAEQGFLECLDFDDEGAYHAYKDLTEAAGLAELTDRIETGYLEETPAGGRHWLWRCLEIESSQKLARRRQTQEDGTFTAKALIETRGEGGYVIVSPSSSNVHPSGKPYTRLSGKFHTIPNITPEERALLLTLARSLDEIGPSDYKEPRVGNCTEGERPGDYFNRDEDVESLIREHGWTFLFDHAGTCYWRRPGKTWGVSATTNHDRSGRLWVFSTSTPLPTGQYLTPFAVYTFLKYGGDFSSAARTLAQRYPQSRRKSPAVHTVAEELLEVALEHYEPGLSTEGEGFLIPREGPRVARLLRTDESAFKGELTRLFLDRHGRVPAANPMSTALLALKGKTLQAEPTQLYLRLAKVESDIWVDLAQPSGQVVRISPEGWSVENQAPVMFRHTELTGPLPVPEPGDLQRMRDLINVDDDGWALVAGWLVSALHPDISHPILILEGPQGTAKSTCARMLSELIDPSPASLRSAPTSERDWAVSAAGSSVVALDNLSGVPGWLSDALCRAVTGDGHASRRLYTNSELHVSAFKRSLILTGISLGTLRTDLLERAIRLELPTISGTSRRLESQLLTDYARAKPGILGGLLSCVANTLKHLGEAGTGPLPRMADHARVLEALDRRHSFGTLEAYLKALERTMGTAVESDEVGRAVMQLMATQDTWQGNASGLLATITPEFPSSSWPTSPERLSHRLNKLVSQLDVAGLTLERGGNGHGRWIRLAKMDKGWGTSPAA